MSTDIVLCLFMVSAESTEIQVQKNIKELAKMKTLQQDINHDET